MSLLRLQRKYLPNTHAEWSYELLTAVAMNSRLLPPVILRVVSCLMLDSYWLLDLLFDPEDGGRILLRNVGKFLLDYTA
jgi:hypothetical protein